MPSFTEGKTIHGCKDSLARVNQMFWISNATTFNNDVAWSHS